MAHAAPLLDNLLTTSGGIIGLGDTGNEQHKDHARHCQPETCYRNPLFRLTPYGRVGGNDLGSGREMAR